MKNNIIKFNVFNLDNRKNVPCICDIHKRWYKAMKRAVLGSGVNGNEMIRLIKYLDMFDIAYPLNTRNCSLTEMYSDLKPYRRYKLEWYYQYSDLCCQVVEGYTYKK